MGEDARALIYKVLTAADWAAAQKAGLYSGSADDARDGFLHFSTARQLAETLRRHYAGAADLVLLTVRAEGLDIVWEPSRGGALFPHLYAPLPLSVVMHAEVVRLGADGAHLLPKLA